MINNLYLVILAVFCNVFAQISLKKASASVLDCSGSWIFDTAGIFYLISGLLLYGISFVLTLKIYKSNELGIITPVMIGLIFLLTLFLSSLIFKEPLTAKKVIGSLLVICGVLVVSLK